MKLSTTLSTSGTEIDSGGHVTRQPVKAKSMPITADCLIPQPLTILWLAQHSLHKACKLSFLYFPLSVENNGTIYSQLGRAVWESLCCIWSVVKRTKQSYCSASLEANTLSYSSRMFVSRSRNSCSQIRLTCSEGRGISRHSKASGWQTGDEGKAR